VQVGEAFGRSEGGDGAGAEQRGGRVDSVRDEGFEIAVVVVLVADEQRVDVTQ
jgi:hypothetical protein